MHKNSRIRRSSMGGGGEDRLSDLPDCLIHEILSRLKARQVVQTSVLSRRWRHLWRSVPCLDVDHREFDRFDRFEDFVDGLLSYRCATVSSLHAFRLTVRANGWRCRWVRRAINFSPAVLAVRKEGHHRFILPSLAVAGARRLTQLHLDNVTFGSGSGLEDLLASGGSGLPSLETLELRGCSHMSPLRRIESATLKHLAVVDCSIFNGWERELDVHIVAPRLTTLRLGLRFHRDRRHSHRYLQTGAGFAIVEAPSVAEASISVADHSPYDAYPADEATMESKKLSRTLKKLLASLSNVSSLELSCFKGTSGQLKGVLFNYIGLQQRGIPNDFSEEIMLDCFQHRPPQENELPSVPLLQSVLDDEPRNLPVFGKLRTLVLDECYISDDLRVVWRLLNLTPFLERLTMQCCKFPGLNSYSDGPGGVNDWKKPSNLKLVEIKYKDREDHGLHESLLGRSEHYRRQDMEQRNKVLSELSRSLPKTTVQMIKDETN